MKLNCDIHAFTLVASPALPDAPDEAEVQLEHWRFAPLPARPLQNGTCVVAALTGASSTALGFTSVSQLLVTGVPSVARSTSAFCGIGNVMSMRASESTVSSIWITA